MFDENFLKKLSQRDEILLKRAFKTIKNNIIEKPDNDKNFVFGDLRGIVPSPSTYKGVWNWDGAFHMIAASYFDKKLAEDQAEILFSHMSENGQLPDVIYTNGDSVTKFTKPPVIGWAIMCSDKISPDVDFLKKWYPYVVKNIQWWENNRSDGTLFFYDVSKMESGWDNTVRFDFPHKINRCYAIDLNCFMADYYRAAAYIAEKAGMENDCQSYIEKREELAKNINSILFSQEKRYYCDYNFKLKRFTNRLSPASFMPLFAGIADSEKAEAMKKLAENPNYFYKGMPTISYNNRHYNSAKYWRGPCWLNTAYFAIRGLYDYGYKELAMEYIENILSWCYKNSESIYEYYDSKSGKGLGAENFGWSSVFIIEMILLKYAENII